MKNFKFKNIFSLLLVTLLVWSSSLNVVVAESVNDESTTATSVEEEIKEAEIIDDAEAEEVSTNVTEPTEVDDIKSTEAPEEVPDEMLDVVAKEELSTVELSEEEKDATVTFSFYILDDTNAEVFLMSVDIDETSGKKLSAPFKPFVELFGEVHSITGGDFTLEGDNLVGTAVDGLNVKIVFPFDEAFFDTSTLVMFIDEDGFPVIDAPDVSFDEAPGTVVTYNPPQIPGYKYNGSNQFTIPDADDEDFGIIYVEYERIPLSLSVSHVDENGNSLKSESFEGKIGDFVEIDTNISGYTFVGVANESSLNGNVYYSDNDFDFEEEEDFEVDDSDLLGFLDFLNFWFGDSGIVEEDPVEENFEEDSYVYDGSFVDYEFGTSSETLVLKYRKNKAAAVKTTTKTLPKTGIENSYTTLVGVAVLATGLYVYNFKKKNI